MISLIYFKVNTIFYFMKKTNKKINLIFDLDETLVQMGNTNHNNLGFFIKNNKYVFLRPYCRELLKYCFNNYIISFWTSGSYKYCKIILDIILTPKQYQQTKIIICKSNDYYYEIKNNNKYKTIKYYKDDTLISDYVKSLNLLWNKKEFSCDFDSFNTLLIDDNFFLEKINPDNFIKITPWCRYLHEDNSLLRLKYCLKQNKETLGKLSKMKKKLFTFNILNNDNYNYLDKNIDIDEIKKSNYNCRKNLILYN